MTVYRNDNPAGLVSFSPAPPRDLLPDCPPTEDIVAYAQQVLPQKFDVSAQEIAEGRAVWLTDMAVSPGTDIELALVAALRCLFLEKIFVSHAWCLSPQVQPPFKRRKGQFGNSTLSFCMRTDFIAGLVTVRQAVVVDYDAIATVLGDQHAQLEQQYGELFISRLIENQKPGRDVALVGCADNGTPLAFIHASAEVDLPSLSTQYDFSAFDFGEQDGTLLMLDLVAVLPEAQSRIGDLLVPLFEAFDRTQALFVLVPPGAGHDIEALLQYAVQVPCLPNAAPSDQLFVVPLLLLAAISALSAGSTDICVRPALESDTADLLPLFGNDEAACTELMSVVEHAATSTVGPPVVQPFVITIYGSPLGVLSFSRASDELGADLRALPYLESHFQLQDVVLPSQLSDLVPGRTAFLDLFAIDSLLEPLVPFFLLTALRRACLSMVLRHTLEGSPGPADRILARTMRRVLPLAQDYAWNPPQVPFVIEDVSQLDPGDAGLATAVAQANAALAAIDRRVALDAERVSQPVSFGLLFSSRRTLAMPPPALTLTRVVLLGEGDTVYAAAQALLQLPLRIPQLTVVVTGSIPTEERGHCGLGEISAPQVEAMDLPCHATVIRSELSGVDVPLRTISLENGTQLHFDRLLLAPHLTDDTLHQIDAFTPLEAAAQSGEGRGVFAFNPTTQEDFEEFRAGVERIMALREEGYFDEVERKTQQAAEAAAADETVAVHGVLRPNVYGHGEVVVVGGTLAAFALLRVALEAGCPPELLTLITPLPEGSPGAYEPFCSEAVATALYEHLRTLGITVKQGLQLAEVRTWSGGVNSVRLSHPTAPQLVLVRTQGGEVVSQQVQKRAAAQSGNNRTRGPILEFPCSLVATSNASAVPVSLFRSLHSAGVVMDSRIVIDGLCRTSDNDILAYGQCCCFTRRMHKALAADPDNSKQTAQMSTQAGKSLIPDPAQFSASSCGEVLALAFLAREAEDPLVGRRVAAAPVSRSLGVVCDPFPLEDVPFLETGGPDEAKLATIKRQAEEVATSALAVRQQPPDTLGVSPCLPTIPHSVSPHAIDQHLMAAAAVAGLEHSLTEDVASVSFSRPCVTRILLPSASLFSARVPGQFTPVSVWKSESGFGRLLETGSISAVLGGSDAPYVCLHVVGTGIIHSVVVLSVHPLSDIICTRLALLPGLPVTLLGDVEARLKDREIPCLLEYFSQPWMSAAISKDIRPILRSLSVSMAGSLNDLLNELVSIAQHNETWQNAADQSARFLNLPPSLFTVDDGSGFVAKGVTQDVIHMASALIDASIVRSQGIRFPMFTPHTNNVSSNWSDLSTWSVTQPQQ